MREWDGYCQRCEQTVGGRIMSKFNLELICFDCKDREKRHPRYAEANAAEIAPVMPVLIPTPRQEEVETRHGRFAILEF